MKSLISLLLITAIVTQALRPNLPLVSYRCVKVACVCVPANIAPLIRVYCPNPRLNSCIKKFCACVNTRRGCEFVRTRQCQSCWLQRAPVCVRAGCSGELCVEESKAFTSASLCWWKPEFQCYAQPSARCEAQADNTCGWTQNKELTTCIDKARNGPICVVSNCGKSCHNIKDLTTDSDVICPVLTPEFSCYARSVCEVQADGNCGWSRTESLNTCIKDITANPELVDPIPFDPTLYSDITSRASP